MDQEPANARPAGTAADGGPDDAERRRMAERIIEVGALSEFVLALQDGVKRGTTERGRRRWNPAAEPAN